MKASLSTSILNPNRTFAGSVFASSKDSAPIVPHFGESDQPTDQIPEFVVLHAAEGSEK